MSNADRNPFGGGKATSLYTPMSDVEMEVLERLLQAQDFRVVLVGWGTINQPRVVFGDHRMKLSFRCHFNRPPPPGVPVHYFDMELRTGAGLLLFKQRQKSIYLGRPITIAAGMFLDMEWHIAIQHIDPKVVKAIKPGAVGLTSANFDRDTGDATMFGNRRLHTGLRQKLVQLRRFEHASRIDTAQQTARAIAMENAAVKAGKLRKK